MAENEAIQRLASEIGHTVHLAMHAQADAAQADAAQEGGGGLPFARPDGYALGRGTPPPFHVWKCKGRAGWEMYLPEGAARGAAAEPLPYAGCLDDSQEHAGCKVLYLDQPGKYVAVAVRCVVAAGAFPAGWCGQDSPSGRLCYKVRRDNEVLDPRDWKEESEPVDVAVLGDRRGQLFEGVAWLAPASAARPFDFYNNGFSAGVRKGAVLDWGLASEVEVPAEQVELDYSGDLYLAFRREGFVLQPGSSPVWDPWRAYKVVDDDERRACEAEEAFTASSTSPVEYAFSHLYTLENGCVVKDWRQPVCIGGGGGGGSSVPDCRWIDPVESETAETAEET